MDKLVLADIQALAASVDYGGRGFLQPSSAALGLSAALFLSNLDVWQGAGYSLTDVEIDDIAAMIAQLENDLTNTGDMAVMDECKVTISAPQIIAHATTTLMHWTVDIYDSNDMHDPASFNARIFVVNEGVHIISCFVEFAAVAIGYRAIYLRKTPASGPVVWMGRENIQNVLATTTPDLNFSDQDYAYPGDYYEVLVYQNSGGPVSVLAGTFLPFFAIIRP